MQDVKSEHTSTRVSDDERRSLAELRQTMDEHISALQAAGRAILTRKTNGDGTAPTEINIAIKVGLDADRTGSVEFRDGSSTNCYTETYVCGKSTSGYITCTVDVCMTVGPVTVQT